jgi:hypothetical protein
MVAQTAQAANGASGERNRRNVQLCVEIRKKQYVPIGLPTQDLPSNIDPDDEAAMTQWWCTTYGPWFDTLKIRWRGPCYDANGIVCNGCHWVIGVLGRDRWLQHPWKDLQRIRAAIN